MDGFKLYEEMRKVDNKFKVCSFCKYTRDSDLCGSSTRNKPMPTSNWCSLINAYLTGSHSMAILDEFFEYIKKDNMKK
jgi:hypothetical protein